MPQSLQVKLLRVLEERKFSKVGSPRTKNFDIRIISATNKNTEDLKNSDTFRQDLFYRICTFEIHIPPLRKRKEDIPLLTEYFILHYASRMKRKIRQISQETFDVLLSYPFPGNVRELRNLCERAAILCDNGLITADHFPEVKSNSGTATTSSETVFNLNELEKQTIEKALKVSDNNISQASKLLGIQWNALYRRMQKYGMS